MKNQIKNLYFIDRFPFTKDFYKRFEFEQLEEHNYNVQFIDISRFLKRKKLESTLPATLSEHRITFKNKSSFRSFIKENRHNSIVISTVPFIASSAWMYLTFFNSKIPYILLNYLSFPSFSEHQRLLLHKKEKIMHFFQRLEWRKVIKKPSETYTYIRAKLSVTAAKMIISSKQNKVCNNILTDKNTVVRYSFSSDYKEARKIKNAKRIIKEKYAIFIDQYFYHHPDFKTKHIIHSFTDVDYYTQLNSFLTDFSDKTGLKVVIASHPRRHFSQENDFSPTFDLYYNKTAELIKDSEIVLMHFSTAISFAVIYNRPFLLLNSKIFKGTVENKINAFAKYFKKEPFDIAQPFFSNGDNIFSLNQEIYQRYLNSFIIHPKAKHETFHEIIISFISTQFN